MRIKLRFFSHPLLHCWNFTMPFCLFTFRLLLVLVLLLLGACLVFIRCFALAKCVYSDIWRWNTIQLLCCSFFFAHFQNKSLYIFCLFRSVDELTWSVRPCTESFYVHFVVGFRATADTLTVAESVTWGIHTNELEACHPFPSPQYRVLQRD